jgi:hypothetical protein
MYRLLSLLITVILHLPGLEAGAVNLGSEQSEVSIEVVIRENVERQSHKKVIIPFTASTEAVPQTAKLNNTQLYYDPEQRNTPIYLLNRSILI